MLKDYLPIQVNPQRFIENATNLHGLYSISKLDRLKASLFSPEGDVEAEIQFGTDHGTRFMKGNVQAHLTLQCQRCMEPFIYGIMADFTYGIVQGEEEAKRLSSKYDPLIVVDNNLNIQDIIEGELIVNLPIVPMHPKEDCKVQLPLVVADPKVVIEKENPFKVIESLKVKKKE